MCEDLLFSVASEVNEGSSVTRSATDCPDSLTKQDSNEVELMQYLSQKENAFAQPEAGGCVLSLGKR